MSSFDRAGVSNGVRRRILYCLVGMLVVMLALLLRSWYLQVLHHEKYLAQAKNNRIRTVAEKPERGLIYDRLGRPLAVNVPTFELAVVLDDVENLTETVQKIAKILGVPSDPMLKIARRQRRSVPYLPVTVHRDLTLKQVAEVEWNHLPGVAVLGGTRRKYPYGTLAAHVLGYVGDVTEDQLSQDTYTGVLPGSRVGQTGAEASFDSILMGSPGARRIEVDAKGFEVRELGRNPPQLGDDVYLTIDIDVQRVAEKAMKGKRGAVIAVHPQDGQVIALVSAPQFDPAEMSASIGQQRWDAIISNPGRPLINRVIQGVYPPGSIFKLPVAVALLEVLGPTPRLYCSGRHSFMGRDYRDWKLSGHGPIGLQTAIVESCDVFFYEFGHRLGINTIAEYAGKFGMGRLTGINLPGERSGLIPTTDWKERTRGQAWFPGETLSASIGQGYVSASPLQITMMMAALGVNGQRRVPTVRLGIWDRAEADLVLDDAVELPTAKMQKSTYRALRESLVGVVSKRRGTGKAARSEQVVIAGKTGTAQVVSMAESGPKREGNDIPYRLRDHAWFAAFAPADKPQIAVTVLVEHGGHGGSAAGPIARKVIEAYMLARSRYQPSEQLLPSLRQQDSPGKEVIHAGD